MLILNPVLVSLVQVLELPTGKVLATLLGHTKTVFWCQFSQDGQTLITSSEDATIRVGSPLSSFPCLLPFFTVPIDFSSPIPIPHVSKTTWPAYHDCFSLFALPQLPFHLSILHPLLILFIHLSLQQCISRYLFISRLLLHFPCAATVCLSVCACTFRPFTLCQPHTIHALFLISSSFSSSSFIIFCWQSCPPLTLFHIYAAHTYQHHQLLILQPFMLIQLTCAPSNMVVGL